MTKKRDAVAGIALLLGLGAGCAALPGEGGDEPNALGGKGDYIGRCDGAEAPMRRCYGQSRFHSVVPSWDFGPMRALEAGGPADARQKSGEIDRTVVDSDIYRHDPVSGLMYVLNSYRGFQVIDASNADAPRLVGSTPLGGYPIEMFQEGGHAFVLIDSFEAREVSGSWVGSVLRVYDVGTDPESPIAIAEFPVAGHVTGARMLPARDGDGRLVSNVIYVASNVWERSALETTTDWAPYSFIKSIDVTRPSLPVAKDEVRFEGDGRTLHVTPEAIFVAGADHGDYARWTTEIQHVDISDLGGDITVGASTRIDGTLSWGEPGERQLDFFRGHLRAATQLSGTNPETGRWETSLRMTTLTVPDMRAADTFDFAPTHSILAAKFEGDLAYVFHATNVDPLEIIDLRDPRDVRSLGLLEIAGFVDRIETRGDHLIALGRQQDAEGRGRSLSLHVFDVADPTRPAELGVATVGESWPWTSATHDLASFRIIDEQGLVLLPVSESRTDESGRWTHRQWLQLFSFDLGACDAGDRATCARTRGEIEGHGAARRAFPVEDRVVSFSDVELQVSDVSNPDLPRIVSTLELAADLQAYRVMNGYGILLVGQGDYANRGAELRIVDAVTADERRPVATLALDSPTGALHEIDADHLLLVASDWGSGDTIFTLVNVADPTHPRVAGRLKTAELGFARFSRRLMPYTPAPSKSYEVAGGALVAFTWPQGEEGAGGKLRAFSVLDARERLSVDIGAETVVDMTAEGTTLYVTTYEPVATEAEEPGAPSPILPAGSAEPAAADATAASLLPSSMISPWRPRSQTVAYKLRVFDLADPRNPTVTTAISVPGKYAGTMRHRDGSTILLTMDAFTHEGATVSAFDALTLDLERGEAALDDVFGTDTDVERIFVRENRAFFVRNPRTWDYPIILEGGAPSERPSASLVALTLAQNSSTTRGRIQIRRLGEKDLGAGSYASLTLVRDDLAFVRGGYGSVEVYDVSHPRRGIVEVASLRTSSGWWSGEMYFDGYRLYLANGLYGLDILPVIRDGERGE